jgi:ribose transport system permease protein
VTEPRKNVPSHTPRRVHAASPAEGAALRTRGRWRSLAEALTEYAVLAVLAVMLVVAAIVNHGFWDSDNLRNIATQNAPIAIVSFGMTLVIVSGMYDLSVGSLFAAGAVVFAQVSVQSSIGAAALVALLVGLVAGILNGLTVTVLRVNSFIATIGTAAVFSGAVLAYAHSTPVIVEDPAFQKLGLSEFAKLPISVIIAGAIFVIAGVALSRTIYGRYLHAVGGNREAARLAGIRINVLHVSVFAIVGVCAVLGGMITASRLSVGEPTLGVADVALQSFAIVIIGGTSVYGGEGAMWRTLCGVLILGVMNNTFNYLVWDASRQRIAQGLILIGAVALDVLRRRSRA